MGQLLFMEAFPWQLKFEKGDENVYVDSNFVKELHSIYIHRLLDSIISLYMKKDPILSLNSTESLRIVFSEVLNSSLQAFTF